MRQAEHTGNNIEALRLVDQAERLTDKALLIVAKATLSSDPGITASRKIIKYLERKKPKSLR